MEILLSHWHCILPAIAIVIGVIFMNRDKSKEKSDRDAAAKEEHDRD